MGAVSTHVAWALPALQTLDTDGAAWRSTAATIVFVRTCGGPPRPGLALVLLPSLCTCHSHTHLHCACRSRPGAPWSPLFRPGKHVQLDAVPARPRLGPVVTQARGPWVSFPKSERLVGDGSSPEAGGRCQGLEGRLGRGVDSSQAEASQVGRTSLHMGWGLTISRASCLFCYCVFHVYESNACSLEKTESYFVVSFVFMYT
jgi:hypothetical protein